MKIMPSAATALSSIKPRTPPVKKKGAASDGIARRILGGQAPRCRREEQQIEPACRRVGWSVFEIEAPCADQPVDHGGIEKFIGGEKSCRREDQHVNQDQEAECGQKMRFAEAEVVHGFGNAPGWESGPGFGAGPAPPSAPPQPDHFERPVFMPRDPIFRGFPRFPVNPLLRPWAYHPRMVNSTGLLKNGHASRKDHHRS